MTRDKVIIIWKAAVLAVHPDAQFTEETGEGETYGEKGDVVAHDGPDMQADVVGVFTHEMFQVMV